MRMVWSLWTDDEAKHTADRVRTCRCRTGALVALPYALYPCEHPSPGSFNTLNKKAMPTYHIEMIEGRTIEQKRRLVQEITRITVEVLGGSPESVDILITDVKRENWATGGKLWTDPRS